MLSGVKVAGKFITFEGGEAVGKSTQISLLANFLKNHGKEVILTREPGGTPNAEAIRKLLLEGEIERWDPLSELFLLTAGRRDHVLKLIKPALARGAWVLCDRFFDSSLVYQGSAQGLGIEKVREITRLALKDFEPDLTFILDLPLNISTTRLFKRQGASGDRFEKRAEEFHHLLREGYQKVAALYPNRCFLIEAQGLPEEVSLRLQKCLQERFF